MSEQHNGDMLSASVIDAEDRAKIDFLLFFYETAVRHLLPEAEAGKIGEGATRLRERVAWLGMQPPGISIDIYVEDAQIVDGAIDFFIAMVPCTSLSAEQQVALIQEVEDLRNYLLGI